MVERIRSDAKRAAPQGCSLSPLLFDLAIQMMLLDLRKQQVEQAKVENMWHK